MATEKLTIRDRKNQLRTLRGEISSLDQAFLDVFVHYLNVRMSLVSEIGIIKKELRVPIRDLKIEGAVKTRFRRALGKLIGNPAAERFAATILRCAREKQK